LPALVEAFAALRTDFILDGELCLCDDRGRPNFRAFHAEMRQGRPDTSRMCYFSFDLLWERDVDLRGCRCRSASAIWPGCATRAARPCRACASSKASQKGHRFWSGAGITSSRAS
jgi:hypothetical protein